MDHYKLTTEWRHGEGGGLLRGGAGQTALETWLLFHPSETQFSSLQNRDKSRVGVKVKNYPTPWTYAREEAVFISSSEEKAASPKWG